MLQQQLDRYLRYLEQDTENTHLLLSICDSYRLLGHFELAKHYLDQAKQYSVEHQHLVCVEAKLLHHMSDIESAISLLEASPVDDETQGLLALLYFDGGDIDKASFATNQALKINRANTNALMVELLIKSLDNKADINEIEAILKINPNESRLWYVLGAAQLNKLNCTAAIAAFQKATTLHPDFYDAWICLGYCHLLENALPAAEAACQQALTIDSTQAEAYALLGMIRVLQHQTSTGVDLINQAETIDPTCHYINMALAIVENS